MSAPTWTAEEDAVLRAHGDSMTQTELAWRLGKSRDAVAGRIRRLGLDKRRVKPTPKPRRRKGPGAFAGGFARGGTSKPPRPAESRHDPDDLELLSIPKARPGQGCRFIAGEARGAATVYCDRSRAPGSSWCAYHRAICVRAVVSYDRRQVRGAEKLA
jgi:hypothetical protein